MFEFISPKITVISKIVFVIYITSGPTIGVFKRFQTNWPVINKSSFKVAADDVFNGMPNGLRQEMISFYQTAIRDKTPREDYRELLQL